MEKRKITSELNSEFNIEYQLSISEDSLVFFINGEHEVEANFNDVFNENRLKFKGIKNQNDIDIILLPTIDKYLSYWKDKEEFIELMKKIKE